MQADNTNAAASGKTAKLAEDGRMVMDVVDDGLDANAGQAQQLLCICLGRFLLVSLSGSVYAFLLYFRHYFLSVLDITTESILELV
ncbi:MAG: hypothetical protein V4634_19935 [Pseudomonadota bacterium]